GTARPPPATRLPSPSTSAPASAWSTAWSRGCAPAPSSASRWARTACSTFPHRRRRPWR
ncbi:hypothetical protein IWQ56_003796, partial [Coemansia nantahalensis]